MVINGKIYEDAKDLHVSGRVFYAKTASGTTSLYSDKAQTVAAVGADVFAAYLAGNLVIVNAGSMCVPTACVVDSTNSLVKVDILTVASSTATVVTCQAAIASGDTETAALFGQIVPA